MSAVPSAPSAAFLPIDRDGTLLLLVPVTPAETNLPCLTPEERLQMATFTSPRRCDEWSTWRSALRRYHNPQATIAYDACGAPQLIGEALHFVVHPRDSDADHIGGLVRVAAKPRAVQIQHECGFFAEQQGAERDCFRIDARRLIIPRVVVRNAVLALISLFHTILVDERDGEHRDVLPECAPESIVRQNRAQKTLHGVGRHRFARMVTRREQDCEFRSVFPECEQFHLPPFSAAAEYAGARRVPDTGGACRFVSREARTAPAAAPGLLKSHRSRLLKKTSIFFYRMS